MKKNKLTFFTLAILGLLALVGFAVFSQSGEDPFSGEKEVWMKAADPSVYSNSAVKEFNHIDSVAEAKHQEALDLMSDGGLQQAESLLKDAIETYEGFHGYHYFALLNSISLVYLRMGDEQKYEEYASKSIFGSESLLKQEKSQ